MPSDPQFRPKPHRSRVKGSQATVQKLSSLSKIRLVILANKTLNQITAMKTHSWKTTLGGLLAGAAPFVKGMLPDGWQWVSDAMISIGALIIGLSARDNNVTSEEAGAK